MNYELVKSNKSPLNDILVVIYIPNIIFIRHVFLRYTHHKKSISCVSPIFF